eukprot:TRINITY_DN253_c0_g1_i1.p1 TRINITY_DN253_c0_g1~~TRINITY_DN253_c0_g1_i1.p1  ORF type:complete len:169 (-),score=27.94 TRINITY_DN253_c0_g1_i1:252-758(-)
MSAMKFLTLVATIQGVAAIRETSFDGGSSDASTICKQPCGARSVTIDGQLFDLGQGKGMKFSVERDTCLNTCVPVKIGYVFQTSCDKVLLGSTKVSKNKKYKLCCYIRKCPAEKLTSTSTSLPVVDEKPVETTEVQVESTASTTASKGVASGEHCLDHSIQGLLKRGR